MNDIYKLRREGKEQGMLKKLPAALFAEGLKCVKRSLKRWINRYSAWLHDSSAAKISDSPAKDAFVRPDGSFG